MLPVFLIRLALPFKVKSLQINNSVAGEFESMTCYCVLKSNGDNGANGKHYNEVLTLLNSEAE